MAVMFWTSEAACPVSMVESNGSLLLGKLYEHGLAPRRIVAIAIEHRQISLRLAIDLWWRQTDRQTEASFKAPFIMPADRRLIVWFITTNISLFVKFRPSQPGELRQVSLRTDDEVTCMRCTCCSMLSARDSSRSCRELMSTTVSSTLVCVYTDIHTHIHTVRDREVLDYCNTHTSSHCWPTQIRLSMFNAW